ncbi:MAG: YgaP family membrane protein [Poseidonia sp.]
MKNVGGKERMLRAAFGSSVVVVDFLATVHIEIVFLLIGLWGVLTSAFGYCPFNGLLNRNTCAIDLQPTHS